MLPDPILGLLSFVGLATYCGLGCVTGAVTARANGWRWREGKWAKFKYHDPKDKERGGYWHNPRDSETPWNWIGWLVVGWPAWLGLLAAGGALMGVCGAIYGVGYFPFKVGRSMVTYVAQIGD